MPGFLFVVFSPTDAAALKWLLSDLKVLKIIWSQKFFLREKYCELHIPTDFNGIRNVIN